MPTLEQQVDDLRAVMDATGVERACLLGSGDGAAVAAMFASTFPTRISGLLLWEPTARGAWAPDYPWGSREPETRWLGSKFASAEHIDWSLPRQYPSWSGDPEFRRRFVRVMRLGASPSSFAAFYRMGFDIDVRHLLGAIQAPTLVMHGRVHAAVAILEESRYIAARIPGARLVEFAEHDAAFWAGDPEPVAALMRTFISDVWNEAASLTPNRVLATVLFTDLVGSTEQAVALGRAGRRRCEGTTPRSVASWRISTAARSTPPATDSSPPASTGRPAPSAVAARSETPFDSLTSASASASTLASAISSTESSPASPSRSALASQPRPRLAKSSCPARERPRGGLRPRL